ncbi:acyl-protein thioesterase 1 [Ephemerocybe angulata]|uniref:Acyl-protein thioesterase 1 n=1 Tax=Ephemerocybe angulata TaxID=980116 RepID=A0A8H6ICT3_9AGAR|nr:acyl-protein thioesterase 1 [Tulosesus angulatus]
MKVTGNGGYVMQSWFDVYNFDIENREEDAVGLAGAADWLNAFVDREVEEFGIPPERVIVGGLSQGGAVVCRALVGSERRLGGAFMLCSYVPLRRRVLEMKTPFASQIPLFWGHGIMDAQVTFPLALRSAKQLALDLETTFLRTSHPLTPESLQEDFKRQSEGTGKSSNSSAAGKATLRFCYYGDLGHWFSEEEISDLAVWMNGILGNGRYKEVGGVGEAEGEEEGEAGMDVDDG